MKILYVQTIRLDADLCSSSRLGLAGALVEVGCDVTMVASYLHQRPSMPRGVRLIGIPAIGIPYANHAWYSMAAHVVVLAQILRRRPDVVLLDPYTFHCAFPVDLLAWIGLVPLRVVMDVRSGIFHERHRGTANRLRLWLRDLSFGYARRLFAGFTTISPMLRDTLVRDYRLSAARIGIWQSGVEMAAMSSGRRAGNRRRFRVMYHGTFGIDRGLLETVEAMRLLEASRDDVELFLLGSGTEEALLRRASAGLSSVHFHAPVPHEKVPDFLADCDVGILPFKPTPVMRSSSPLKLMEYVAARRPVIASRIESIEGVVGPGGAFYLDDQTPESIARAIARAVDQPSALLATTDEARAAAQDRLSWERQGASLREFLAALA